MKNLDITALRQGGSVALVFAVPFSIAGRVVADHDSHSPWASVLWLAALAGFTLGAGIAAWVQTKELPLLHGMVCASATYAAAQLVFIVVKLVRGSTVHWLAVFFTFTAVLFAGMVGGGFGSALRKRGIMPARSASAQGGQR